jgi:hypothetical protein
MIKTEHEKGGPKKVFVGARLNRNMAAVSFHRSQVAHHPLGSTGILTDLFINWIDFGTDQSVSLTDFALSELESHSTLPLGGTGV